MAHGSMPWQTDSSKGEDASEHFKYQYHPGGDPNTKPKDAPSALHSVIVPNVNLPKVGLFWEYRHTTLLIGARRNYTSSLINGVRSDDSTGRGRHHLLICKYNAISGEQSAKCACIPAVVLLPNLMNILYANGIAQRVH